MTIDEGTKDEGTKDEDTPFITRWARRKQESQRIPGDAARVPSGAPGRPPHAPPDEPDAAEPPFDPASLPKVDELTAQTDITGFLRKGVPEELKRMALRRVWSLDPQIRDFVEVAENQYNWNVAGGVPGFGPLAEGTDMQALLAQATGQLQKVLPEAAPKTVLMSAPAHEASAMTAVASPAPDALGVEPEVAGTHPMPQAKSVAVADNQNLAKALTTAPPAQTGPEDGAATSHRRRHGGALPRV